jgi:pilus assembly protein CpaE
MPGVPVPAASILLVSADATTSTEITETLTRIGHQVLVAADPSDGFRLALDHQLVILDVIPGDGSAALCREIRGTPSLAAIPVLCIAAGDQVEERIAFLEAGADDVIARPLDARELEARVEALLIRFQRTKDLAPVASIIGAVGGEHRRIVAVFAPRGGVGTTTIAVNLAMVAALRKPDSVVIVDLDLQFGQVTTHLNVTPRQTLADVVRDEQAMVEPELLRTYTTRHDAGLHVLAAPGLPDLIDVVTPDHVAKVIKTLPGTFDTVVVDAGSRLDERVHAVFEVAELVIFPVIGEIAALNAVHALIDHLSESGSVGAKSIFVLNSVFAREILKVRDVEGALGTKIAAQLPYDPFLYLKAVNEGNPIVRGAPRSPQAEAFGRLAEEAFGRARPPVVAAAASEAPNGRKGGIFGLRRR